MANLEPYPTHQEGWLELLPKRKPKASLVGKYRVDWVVVGAGFTGVSCARRLAELHPEAKILLLEARAVGQGASGRNSGFAVGVSRIEQRYSTGFEAEFKRINRINQFGLCLLKQQCADLSIACDLDNNGYYHAVADKFSFPAKDHFKRYLEASEIEHTVLDREAIADRLGTPHYRHAIHVAGNALLNPATLVRGLADNLPENVQLLENSQVISWDSGTHIELRLEKGLVRTGKVVFATNYEAPKIGLLKRRIIGSTLSGSLTRVLNDEEMGSLGSEKTWGVLSLHSGGATVRLTADRRILIRNTAEYYQSRHLSAADLKERQKLHRFGFERRFPQLAQVPFEVCWSGVEGMSRNGTNFFGAQHKNIYFAGGFNGSGVTRGSAFGFALAEYASGGQSELINDCLVAAPAKWIPPSPIVDVFANLKVRRRFRGVGLDR